MRKIIEGNVALRSGNPREAIQALSEANRLLHTWVGRFDLGRAYLEAGAYSKPTPSSTDASSVGARAMALFLDEIPT